MSARITGLNVTAMTIGGTALLNYFTTARFKGGVDSEDASGAALRYGEEVATKKRLEIDLTYKMNSSGYKTGLDISVFTIGGTNYLTSLDTGLINITTATSPGDGAADLWEFLNATGTSVEITVDRKLTLTPAMMALVTAAGTSGLSVQVAITLGGFTFSAPMLLTMADHGIEKNSVQMEQATFKQKGQATITGTGDTILASALVGTSIVTVAGTYNDSTTDGTYTCDAMIKSASVSFGNRKVSEITASLQSQGAPTFVAAA
ncbi:MAG: hypothetical protein EBR82_34095 [Caulobacteraceae bacterium]|nr:hypothetical protein [Caulobacteraceae bacterium]